MKYLKIFETTSEQQSYLNGVVITPSITITRNNESTINYISEVIEGEDNDCTLIIFNVNGVECQAEDGMTFYDWALSKYYNSLCNLFLIGENVNLKDSIINRNISPDESFTIFYGSGGASIIPYIYTNTIIQPISYMPNYSGFE
jgi:hypothetical protein